MSCCEEVGDCGSMARQCEQVAVPRLLSPPGVGWRAAEAKRVDLQCAVDRNQLDKVQSLLGYHFLLVALAVVAAAAVVAVEASGKVNYNYLH